MTSKVQEFCDLLDNELNNTTDLQQLLAWLNQIEARREELQKVMAFEYKVKLNALLTEILDAGLTPFVGRGEVEYDDTVYVYLKEAE